MVSLAHFLQTHPACKHKVVSNRICLKYYRFAAGPVCLGAATNTAAAGVEVSTIQMLGPRQSAAFLYIHTPKERLQALSAVLEKNWGNWLCLLCTIFVFRKYHKGKNTRSYVAYNTGFCQITLL